MESKTIARERYFMEKDFITPASQAKQIANLALEQKNRISLVNNLIRAKASKGEFFIEFGYLSKEVINTLKEAGYIVTVAAPHHILVTWG